MADNDGILAEEFAISTVRKLRDAGFEALWAGGCVRDRLLGLAPKDYDIATNATPDQVCGVFGRRRTLRIGESFGVVAILGKKPLQPIEVATFRKEAGYSDGRHPDHVAFSSAEEDAQRRDFTINGMFFDPIEGRVIDFVNGRADLASKIVRCIGEARERFAEDRLRMLRAVRIASTFNFQIEPATLAAVKENAQHIVVVSAERIANEMRRMMSHENVCGVLQLVRIAGLRPFVLPAFEIDSQNIDGETSWESGLRNASHLRAESFELACAAILLDLADPVAAADSLAGRWRLANTERERIVNLLIHEATIRRGNEERWTKLQRILIQPFASDAITLAAAVAQARGETNAGIEFCRAKLSLPPQVLNPEPLISGADLIAAGMQPGPVFRTILESVRDRQLDGEISTAEQAIEFALR